MPWYSVRAPLDALLVGHGRQVGLFHLVRYLRDGDRVFADLLDDPPRRG